MDDRDREKFYTAPDDPPDDGELELEPPDEAADEHRRKATMEALESTIDIDEIYREAERNRGSEILENWVRNFRFRFQVKHLLIATAVLAIALTLAKHRLFWTALIVLIMLSVAGLYVYLQLQEKKQQAEADRKREALYARRRAQLAAKTSGHVVGTPEVPAAMPPEIPQLPNEVDQAWLEARDKQAFRVQFSLRELILTMTAAAIVLGMIRLLGSPASTASVLGIVALLGLIILAAGYEPPQIVVLGWWLIVLLYVAVSIFAVFWSGFA